MTYMPHITQPADLRKLDPIGLEMLAAEIRRDLIERVTRTGGHIGSNLGLVEATIALHYVFESPVDRIVFDVSHQSYVHKMLTGRYAAFMQGTTSGYTNPRESAHDPFIVGHTSTAVSLAVGLAKGRELLGGTEHIVAVLGDGSLSGGEAFEGLNNAANVQGNLVIVFNDNEMSIAENRGGMYAGIASLRATGGQSPINLFRALGLDYMYVEKGNDVGELIRALTVAKQSDHPIVVHIHTHKGEGLPWADEQREQIHWIMPAGAKPPAEPPLSALIAQYLAARLAERSDLVVINAATPGAVGLSREWRRAAGDRFVDVGICEPHAVALASGAATRGAKPVMLVLSSFVQRTYDQLSQDLAMNGSPAVIIVYGGGMGYSDPTHAGLYDMAMMANIPGLRCVAPCSRRQLFATLDWALAERECPVVVRVPNALPDDEHEGMGWQVWRRGTCVALVGLGDMAAHAMAVADALHAVGVEATVVAADDYSAVDTSLLDSLPPHTLYVTLENGVLDGGFGQKVAAYLAQKGTLVWTRGAAKSFVDRRTYSQQLEDNRMTVAQLTADIVAACRKR